MLNLIQADLFKLRKSKAIKIIFGIVVINAIIMTAIAYNVSKGSMKDASGIGFLFSDINTISILGAVLAGIFICGDFDTKAIHDAISTGASRSKVIAAKTIVFSCIIALMLLPYAIAVVIALSTGEKFSMGNVGLGFLNLLVVEAGKTFSAADIWKLILIMLTLFIVYIGQLSICVPLAFGLKKPVFVVAIFFGFQILSAQLITLCKSSKIVDNILSWSPFYGDYNLLTIGSGMGDMVKAILVSIMFVFIMGGLTYITFRKTEIK